jgi:1,4-dihydroxy-2-naphthoate polyprenyltransferase
MTIKQKLLVWFKAARSPFLVVSFIPSVLGGIIAYNQGSFDWLTFILVTIGIVSAHSAGDFVDDYFDFKKGNLGNKVQQFHDSPLIDGKVTLKQVMIATLICLAISLGIGVYLLYTIGLPVLIMALIGTFIVLFYTSPPFRMNYRGLGETMLFIAFGPLTVFGVYFVLTQNFSIEPLLASVPLGIFTMNVGLVSNTFDHDDDVKSGKSTIPVRWGQANAVRLLNIVTIIAYLAVIIGVIFKIMPIITLISLITIPISYTVSKKVSLYNDTKNYTPAMGKAIALSSVTGIILILTYALKLFV